MKIAEAAAAILGVEGGPLHVWTILDRIVDGQLFTFDTPDPAGILARKILEQTAQDRNCVHPTFAKVAPNTFALVTWASSLDGADDAFQEDVNQLAGSALVVPKPPTPTPVVVGERRTRYRDPVVSAAVLQAAGHRCEASCSNVLFARRRSPSPYLEAHHLVPMAFQYLYEASLDTTLNILALCPLCHALVHHGEDAARLPVLQAAYRTRIGVLSQVGIVISESALLEFYDATLNN